MAKKDDERILAIRQKANEARQQQKRSEARRRALVQTAIIVGVLAIVAAIVFVVVATNRAGQDVTEPSVATAITVGETSEVPFEIDESAVRVGDADAPVTISLYEDFSCPHCQDYEAVVGDTLTELAATGDVAVEYHPIRYVTDYGTRAASVATCVAVHQPESWLDVHAGLFAIHDATSDGWSYEQFAAFLDGQGIGGDELLDCVESGRYSDWIGQNTRQATEDGVSGTPTLFINGEKSETLLAADELRERVAELVG